MKTDHTNLGIIFLNNEGAMERSIPITDAGR
ncbi:hypothetical protein BH09VER1_BH09VER1_47600 [soil metagenome]